MQREANRAVIQYTISTRKVRVVAAITKDNLDRREFLVQHPFDPSRAQVRRKVLQSLLKVGFVVRRMREVKMLQGGRMCEQVAEFSERLAFSVHVLESSVGSILFP